MPANIDLTPFEEMPSDIKANFPDANQLLEQKPDVGVNIFRICGRRSFTVRS